MINVLIESLIFYSILFLTTINSNEIFPCNITTNIHEQNANVQYQAKTIQDGKIYSIEIRRRIFHLEFIVQFIGYYNELTRSNYITRVFKRSNLVDYEIVKRNNVMQRYPSDFDIVRVC